MHTKNPTLIPEVPNPTGIRKSLKSHRRLVLPSDISKAKRVLQFCLERELVCASGKGGKPHEVHMWIQKWCHLIEEEHLLPSQTNVPTELFELH